MSNRYEEMLAASSDVGGVISDYVRDNVRQYGDFVITASPQMSSDPDIADPWILRCEPAGKLTHYSRLDALAAGMAPAELIERHKDALIDALKRQMQ